MWNGVEGKKSKVSLKKSTYRTATITSHFVSILFPHSATKRYSYTNDQMTRLDGILKLNGASRIVSTIGRYILFVVRLLLLHVGFMWRRTVLVPFNDCQWFSNYFLLNYDVIMPSTILVLEIMSPRQTIIVYGQFYEFILISYWFWKRKNNIQITGTVYVNLSLCQSKAMVSC